MAMARKEIRSWLALSNLELAVLLRTNPRIRGNETLPGIMNKFQESGASVQIKETMELKQDAQLSQLALVCKWNKSQRKQVYQYVSL